MGPDIGLIKKRTNNLKFEPKPLYLHPVGSFDTQTTSIVFKLPGSVLCNATRSTPSMYCGQAGLCRPMKPMMLERQLRTNNYVCCRKYLCQRLQRHPRCMSAVGTYPIAATIKVWWGGFRRNLDSQEQRRTSKELQRPFCMCCNHLPLCLGVGHPPQS